MKSPNSYKTAQQAAQDFASGVQSKAGNYVTGVQRPGIDWAGAASSPAAQQAMQTGLIAAMNDGRVTAGIQRAGNAKWLANAVSKGGQTWATQAAKAAPAYASGMAAVIGDFAGARAAYEAAAGAGGTAGRIAGAAAWSTYMHNQKLARQAAGGR